MALTTGAVLAGGAGRRIGGDKAMLELGGKPLVRHAVDAFAAAGLDCAVVAKASTRLPELDVPVVVEPEEPQHPLAGIVAALRDAGAPLVVLACDMPFAEPLLLRRLATLGHPVAVADDGHRPQPLLARYEPRVLPQLEAALARREPVREAVAALRPHVMGAGELATFGDPERILFNVNDAADLARAEQLLGV